MIVSTLDVMPGDGELRQDIDESSFQIKAGAGVFRQVEVVGVDVDISR